MTSFCQRLIRSPTMPFDHQQGRRCRPARPRAGWSWPVAPLGIALCLCGMVPGLTAECSTILVGKQASTDGSVLMASSCDGDVMGLIEVFPAQDYAPGTELPMYWNVPRPRDYDQYQQQLQQGYDLVGRLPVGETFRSILLAGNVESMTTGGMNEHGLSIAIEFLPMRDGLACDQGVVGPNSNHWTTSLIANGLRRAKTAREAIRLIGSMVETYGFLYYRAPHAGVALPIADKHETWLMEIFGPGKDWRRGSSKPGGVWCARRIPDGHVGCSTNRSRIGRIDLADTDHFMASPNVFSLAQELGFWNSEQPLVWYQAYGGEGTRDQSLREWRALSLAAPSLGLKVTGDPAQDRYPFSVKPDKPLSVAQLTHVMRDAYEGTEFDLTEHEAFQVDGRKSPLARPWGPGELFDLLQIRPERAVCTPTSGYVFIAQLRDRLPAPIAGCLWFAYGPASTSCFVPVYAGVTDFPHTWDSPANFTRIDRQQPQWNFRLVHNLTNTLRYQQASKDVRRVIRPAETAFLSRQPTVEQVAVDLLEKYGRAQTEKFLTAYTHQCMTRVGDAYDKLVDYLMLKYLVDQPELATVSLPRIGAPDISEIRPESPDGQRQTSVP
jgi:dipeptidase